jgi:site-specific DNA-methyltransferase (cytosine-N4-specific)
MLTDFSENFGEKPYYSTSCGQAYHGDSEKLLKNMSPNSCNLVLTSPPFALTRKKTYDNVSAEDYVEWFLPFAEQIHRILTPDGSLVLHLGGSWVAGHPVKNLYQFKLLLALCERLSFHLAQDIYWYNKAKLPTPAQWVAVKRVRLKDAVDNIWWLSKSQDPKADNSRVLKDYSSSMEKLLKEGYNVGQRPSGHKISKKFSKNNNGAIRPNFLDYSNTRSQTRYLRLCKHFDLTPHPARFPIELPLFFIEFLTDEEDLVLDPFAGSNTTGEAAEKLGRRWLSIEKNGEYVKSSKLRFFDSV